jgi:hypothetical protein
MFDICIKGRVKNKNRVYLFAEQVLHDLMPRTTREVELTIEFCTQCEDQNSGYCYGDRDWAVLSVAKTSQGEPFNFDEMMVTLCHELVHAKQYIKGELTKNAVWKGTLYSTDDRTQQPWEQEADALEQLLYDKFKHVLTGN